VPEVRTQASNVCLCSKEEFWGFWGNVAINHHLRVGLVIMTPLTIGGARTRVRESSKLYGHTSSYGKIPAERNASSLQFCVALEG
jgi:hypothetical protein